MNKPTRDNDAGLIQGFCETCQVRRTFRREILSCGSGRIYDVAVCLECGHMHDFALLKDRR